MAAAKYARDQGPGFSNRIERVAIVGVSPLLINNYYPVHEHTQADERNQTKQAGGQVGKHLTSALLGTGKHTVTAITRADSKNVLPDGVEVARVDYDDQESLVSAMRGQQALIISLNTQPPPGTQSRLIAAAASAGVPYVLPNAWGVDFEDEALARESLVGVSIREATREVEALGASRWVAVVCSFWYEYSLSLPQPFYGFDIPSRRVTLFDDGRTAINTSTWAQCSRAVASLLSLPVLPEDEADRRPTVSRWDNRPLYVSSFAVSQRDMLDSLNRVMGTTDADWAIDSEPTAQRYERGKSLLGKSLEGFVTVLYTRVFFPNGGGNFEATKGTANEALGLPREDLDEATRRAVKMAEDRYDPFERYGMTVRDGR